MIQFRQDSPKDYYFSAACPICGHDLRLRYTVWPEDYASGQRGGPADPEILDNDKCNCLLGKEWCKEALESYLDDKYVPQQEDFLD